MAAGLLAIVPVGLAGWVLGLRGGLLAGLVVLPLHTILMNLAGYRGWDVIIRETNGLGPLATIAVGVAVGYWSDLIQALQQQITQRKQAEQALRDSQKRLAGIIDFALDAIISLDADQRVILFNPAAEKMFRCPAAEVIGQPLDRFIPERFREAHREHIRNFGQTNQTKRSMGALDSLTCLRADGKEFPAEISISQVEMAGQKIYTAILRDVTERKQAEEGIKTQLQRLEALHRIDMAIASGLEINFSLGLLLDQVLSLLDVDAAVILLLDPLAHFLSFAAGQGFHSDAIKHTQLQIGKGHAGRVALEQRAVHIPNLTETSDDLTRALSLSHEKFTSYYAVPLIVKGRVKGVLEIFHRSPLHPNGEWINFVETMANQAAIMIEDAGLFSELQRSNFELSLAYETTLEGWSNAMDLRDKETEGHTKRVTDLTVKLAREMSISEDDMIHIRRGALLHDIGKIGVPDRILYKANKLTKKEWEIMRQHPVHAYNLLSRIEFLRPALNIPYCHHEKWDGTGYPRGLKGENIPLSARIFAIVDVWDAITSDRPYRSAWTEEKALKYIKEQSGSYFDPQVVDAFLRLIGEM
jgi:PAS domain S-box-containing protein/putative nucleotidyltransferase with HDIG domain